MQDQPWILESCQSCPSPHLILQNIHPKNQLATHIQPADASAIDNYLSNKSYQDNKPIINYRLFSEMGAVLAGLQKPGVTLSQSRKGFEYNFLENIPPLIHLKHATGLRFL